MSHEVTSSDGLFTVRQAAWHGLGTVFQDYPSRKQAQEIAHPWEPTMEPVFRKVAHTENGVTTYTYDEVPQVRANVRNDNGETLGVVSSSYTNVLNNELWDIAEALEKSGKDVMFETAGSLRGGAQVWVLVRLQEPLVVKGDPRGHTIPYFALQNSFDGSGAFRGQAVVTRIVCANTARQADMDANQRGTSFTFRHSKNVGERIDQAQAALAGWRDSLVAWQEQAEMMIQRKTEPMASVDFLDRFIPIPPEGLVSDKTMQNILGDRSKWLELYGQSVTGEGLQDTAYGLFQASVEFSQWYRRARSAESLFRRSFLDKNDIVARAAQLAMDAPLA